MLMVDNGWLPSCAARAYKDVKTACTANLCAQLQRPARNDWPAAANSLIPRYETAKNAKQAQPRLDYDQLHTRLRDCREVLIHTSMHAVTKGNISKLLQSSCMPPGQRPSPALISPLMQVAQAHGQASSATLSEVPVRFHHASPMALCPCQNARPAEE